MSDGEGRGREKEGRVSESCTSARPTSNGILSQQLINLFFKASILLQSPQQASVSIVLFINSRLIFNVFPSLNTSDVCISYS